MVRVTQSAAAAWDAEYAKGRYLDEPPVPFIGDIITAAKASACGRGLYIGCGNGRNYVPLVEAGLDLVGLDISPVAVEQLSRRMPERRDRLVHGDLSALPAGATYDLVVGIQVFQHGDRAAAHSRIRHAQRLVRPGGLLAVRVNSTRTDLWPDHEVVEADPKGAGLTLRYLAGPKAGLLIHFFDGGELEELLAGMEPVLVRRVVSARRPAPKPGQWSQHEAIWRRVS
ncbi:class I SAM-dependent methyltransferase [Spirillospora albida]|uniref:class I SAM-dependent methyltransferase n=1 Tax=Spirillospora albida TaxID=58123 RepID=UPI0004C05393|nr:class I SAM-dependent methyltransferase [Spirillospora albida]